MCATYWIDDNTAIEILDLINELNKQFGYTTVSYDQLYPDGLKLSGDVYPKALSGVVTKSPNEYTLTMAHWGFPRNEKDVVFNSRSDKVCSSFFWKGAFESKRGFVVCNGFYENKRDSDGNNVRYLFTYPTGQLIYIAAILEKKLSADGNEKEYYSLLTTEANSSVKPIHDRMPLILSEEQLSEWVANRDFANSILTTQMPELEYQIVSK